MGRRKRPFSTNTPAGRKRRHGHGGMGQWAMMNSFCFSATRTRTARRTRKSPACRRGGEPDSTVAESATGIRKGRGDKPRPFLLLCPVNFLTLGPCKPLQSFQSPPLVYYISGAFFAMRKASRRSWSVSAGSTASGYMASSYSAPLPRCQAF